jgi:hypothetical protein
MKYIVTDGEMLLLLVWLGDLAGIHRLLRLGRLDDFIFFLIIILSHNLGLIVLILFAASSTNGLVFIEFEVVAQSNILS